MARGGIKPPKPRPVKEATLTDVSDLFKPEVYDRLGPIGTMNMLQTLTTAAKIPEVTNVPALIDEPVLPALAGEPAAQKKVQRRVSEAKTGLESPKRREILKAARDVAGATMVPVPTSVKDVLIQQVAKPAMKAIPDASIQAAIAAFLKPKLKPVQLERMGRKDFEEMMETGEDPTPGVVTAAEIANFAKLPVEDVEDYLKRTEVDVGQSLVDLSRDFYSYKGFNEGVLDEDPIFANADFLHRGLGPATLAEFQKTHPKVDLSKGVDSLTDQEYDDLSLLAYDVAFDHIHGDSVKRIKALVGEEAAAPIEKALRDRLENLASDRSYDIILDAIRAVEPLPKKPKISFVSESEAFKRMGPID